MGRIYLKDSDKNKKFMDTAKKLGAEYITADGDVAIIVSDTKWIKKKKEFSSDSVEYYKAAIKLTDDYETDIGCIRKSCMNFESKSNFYYNKKEILWITSTLLEILQLCHSK